jgi:hypothetical protein
MSTLGIERVGRRKRKDGSSVCCTMKRVVRQKAACFSVLRSFRHLNEQGTAVFLQGKRLAAEKWGG